MINYQVADMTEGVQNMIEAAAIRSGDEVLLLADRRSDPISIEAIAAGLKAIGAQPIKSFRDTFADFHMIHLAWSSKLIS